MIIRIKPQRTGSEIINTLHMESEETKDLFQTFQQHKTNESIFSDIHYSFEIEGEFEELPSSVDMYVDDEKIDTNVLFRENEAVCLTCRSRNGTPVFSDCYGFVQLRIDLHYQEDNTEKYYSDYFQVLLPDTPGNQAMQKMAEYVYQNHARYLYNRNETVEQDVFGSVESIDGQIGIIREIAEVYMRNLPFFKANAHTKAEYRYSIQDVEKLRVVDSKILKYISLHPEQMAESEKGIKVEPGDKCYLPKKSLVLETERIRNTYENRVILSFIRLVLEESEKLNKRIKNELAHAQSYETYQGYISSARVILKGIEERLTRASKELNSLVETLRTMFLLYKNILDAELIRLNRVPDATGVMRSSVPYRQIFECIVRWFSKGIYSFYNESLMLPMMFNHRLYEYYGLIKLIRMLEKEGYQFDSQRSVNYRYPLRSRVYVQTNHYNTLYFSRRNETIVLYYQPVIWGQQYREGNSNGIRLRRSTSYEAEGSSQHINVYWTPDYLLKYQSDGAEKYLILDAKYSEKVSFLEREMRKLVFKYMFAVQPLEGAEYVGECILYGKAYYADCEMQDAHDVYFNNRERIYWFLSLNEGRTDEAAQLRELSKLMPVLQS